MESAEHEVHAEIRGDEGEKGQATKAWNADGRRRAGIEAAWRVKAYSSQMPGAKAQKQPRRRVEKFFMRVWFFEG